MTTTIGLPSRTIAQVSTRFVPFFFICFCVDFLDRVNIGNFGGLIGPTFAGWIKGTTDSFALSLDAFRISLAATGLIAVLVGRQMPKPATI